MMNRWTGILMLGWALTPGVSIAGEIRGAITVGGKSIGEGVAIDVRCGTGVYSATTDKYGSYRLFIPENGTCQFQLRYRNQTPSREVISFQDSTRYDMVVDRQGETYVLRRK